MTTQPIDQTRVDADTTRYPLPAEHEPVLAEEGGPVFFGGVYEEISGGLPVLDDLTEAFPTGRYVCVDINASHRPEDNTGPLAALFYGFSVLYCMTTSLAHDGAALGTCGFNWHSAGRRRPRVAAAPGAAATRTGVRSRRP